MNIMRTAILLAGMSALFMLLGFMLGGTGGMMVALIIAAAMNLFAYWNSDKMVLRLYQAREVDGRSHPTYYQIVRDLAAKAGLPQPRIYIIDNPQPNAFATGRNPQHAAVAATTGLINRLNSQELAGVMAHELAHVAHRDTLTMTLTATLAGAIGMLAKFALFFSHNRSNNNNPFGAIGAILAMIVAPIAAMLVQMAISRTREYAADRRGAEICGNPLWLASALEKIAQKAHEVPNEAAEDNPATAHMFIINPLSGRGADNLFSTHPATHNRITALQRMAQEMGQGTQGVRPQGVRPPTLPAQGRQPQAIQRRKNTIQRGNLPHASKERADKGKSLQRPSWMKRGKNQRRRGPWG